VLENEAIGLRRFGEREHAIDQNLRVALGDVVDPARDRGEAAVMLLRERFGWVTISAWSYPAL